MKTALQRFMAGLQRMVEAAKDKNHPTVKDSAQAIAEHAAMVRVVEIAEAFEQDRGGRWGELKEALADLNEIRKEVA